MKKTILFDFDGTIVDSGKLIVEIYNDLAERYNYKKVSISEVLHLREIPINDRCKELGIPTHMLPLFLYEARKRYKEHVAGLSIIDGISDVLYKLKDDGFDLHILSSNSISSIKQFLEKSKVNVFDNIFSSKNLFGKHNTIKSFLKNFNINREDIIYIGDEIRDIISCRKCNVKVIAVTWGYDSIDLLLKESPDFVVNKPCEILNAVGNI